MSEPPLDPYKPSLFELLSSTQLTNLLPPSLHYLLTIATHRHPRYLLPILNSFHEIYAGLFLLIEHHHLKRYSSTFVEHFYSLKRERSLAPSVGNLPLTQAHAGSSLRPLSRPSIYKNLIVVVLLPYLLRRLSESHDIHAPRALLGSTYTRLPPNPTLKQRLHHYYRVVLLKTYPSVNALYYFSILIFNLRYLFSSSAYSDPFLWLISTRVRRLSQADFEAFEKLDSPAPADTENSNNLGVSSIFDPRIAGRKALGGLRFLLPTSIFALKFLEWWHASDFARQLGRKATEGLELPVPITSFTPSPSSSKPLTSTSTSSNEKEDNTPANPPISSLTLLPIFVVPTPEQGFDACPICKEEITTATACQTGYVYCYTCIHVWIEGGHALQEAFMRSGGGREGRWESGVGRCAVTGRRVLGGVGGLRRVLL